MSSPIYYTDKIEPIYFVKREISLSIQVKPFAKQRPRVTTRGAFARAYTPKPTVIYENFVKDSYREVFGDTVLEGALEANIEGVFCPPKASSKRKKQEMIDGYIQHVKKPDCDNLAKTVLDALNGVAYRDDSSICNLYISKRYGEEDMVNIRLKEINKGRIYK